MTTETRYRLAEMVGTLIRIVAIGAIGLLAWDFTQTGSTRSLLEAALIGLLVAWPYLRTRLKFRCWMYDYGDLQPFFVEARRRAVRQ